MVAIHVELSLIKSGQIGISVNFPYVKHNWSGGPEDWDNPDKHTTEIVNQQAHPGGF